MAIEELRNMTSEEIQSKLEESREELIPSSFSAMGSNSGIKYADPLESLLNSSSA